MSGPLKLLNSAQLGRVLRLAGFVAVGALASSPLVHAAELRYPLLGVIVGVLEALYRTAVPTQSAPTVTAVPAPLIEPPGKESP
jgi:hypothetical protein